MATKKAVPKSGKSTASKPKTSAKKVTNSAAKVSKSPSFAVYITKKLPFIGALLAEFVGTFLLAAAVITGQGQPIIVLFAITGIVLLVGAASGAHLNPAITVGAWVTRRINWVRALGYIAAQFLGAIAALGLLTAFIGGADNASGSLGYQSAELFKASVLPVGKEWYVFFAEVVGALILGFAIANALREKKDKIVSAFTVGFGIFVALMVAVSAASYVGGSAAINPAVASALQALSWNVWPLAVYVLAPVVGSILGFFLSDVIAANSDGGSDK